MSMRDEGVSSEVLKRADPVVEFGPSRTKQSFKDDVDINKIVARYHKTGLVSHVNQRAPFFGDVSSVGSYQESLERVANAQAMFMALPSAIRDRFENDPVKLLQFLSDESNYDEAVKLGLIDAKKVEIRQAAAGKAAKASGEAAKAPKAPGEGESPKSA